MKKAEIIAKYGEAVYERQLAQNREYKKEHKEEAKEYDKKYKEEHPEVILANNTRSNQELSRKGGKYYDRHLEHMQTGISGKKHKIRMKHGKDYKPYKDIIAPESQIHHEWIPRTADYRGVALVETDQHMHGFVDVIEILEGEIKLLTEEEVRGG